MIGWAGLKLFLAFGVGFILAEQFPVDAAQYTVGLNVVNLLLIPLIAYGGKAALRKLDMLSVEQSKMNVQLTEVCTIVTERASQQKQIERLIDLTADLRVDLERVSAQKVTVRHVR